MHALSRREFLQVAALSVGTLGSAGLASCAQESAQRSEELRSTADSASAAPESSDATKSAASPLLPAFITSFVVMSDTHVAHHRPLYNEHFANALDDIRTLISKPATIVINGDIVDNYFEESYPLIHSICSEHGYDFDKDFVKVMGNHDQQSAEYDPNKVGYDKQHQYFIKEAGTSSVFYDKLIDGQHFIILGPDAPAQNWNNFHFSERQMKWLQYELDKDEQMGRVSYVFCHEPLLNTVRHTGRGSWAETNCITDEEPVWRALRNRSRCIYLSGHIHTYPDIIRPNPFGPLFVNTGAVGPGQLSPEVRELTGEYGSQGWLVSVFTDRIVFRMRNFLEHEWNDALTYTYKIS